MFCNHKYSHSAFIITQTNLPSPHADWTQTLLFMRTFFRKFYRIFYRFPSLYLFLSFLITRFPKCVFNLYERRDAWLNGIQYLSKTNCRTLGFRLGEWEKKYTKLNALALDGIHSEWKLLSGHIFRGWFALSQFHKGQKHWYNQFECCFFCCFIRLLPRFQWTTKIIDKFD